MGNIQMAPVKAKRTYTKGKSVVRPKSAPSKTRGGLNKTEKKETKEIAKKAVNAGKESIYCKWWFDYDTHSVITPTAQPLVSATAILPNIVDPAQGAATCVVFQTGQYKTKNSDTLNTNMGGQCAFPIGGMKYQPTFLDSEHGIQGDYAHFQSGQISLAVYADLVNSSSSDIYNSTFLPLDFRVIHFKIKGKYLQDTGTIYNHLFRDSTNDDVGLSMVGSVKTLKQDVRINSEAVKVLNDISFKLQQPCRPNLSDGGQEWVATATGGPASRPAYPSSKFLKLWTENPKKKIRFSDSNDGVTNDYEPLNWNFNEYVLIMCVRDQTFVGSSGSGNASDTYRMWRAGCSGMTKIRDM